VSRPAHRVAPAVRRCPGGFVAVLLAALLSPAAPLIVRAQAPGATAAEAGSPAAQASAAPGAPPAPAARAAVTAEPSTKIGVLVFGDYYYFASDHAAAFDGQHGFWFRRLYLTVDHAFGATLSARFRLEANSNGKMTAPATSITPYVKDAYVRWQFSGTHQVILGIQPTATVEFVETFSGLRYVEKVAVGLYRLDSSRDFGLGFSGPIDAGHRLHYVAQYGNDSGITSEIDRYKSVRAAVRYETNPGLVAQVAGGYQARAGRGSRSIIDAFVGYHNPAARAGVEYVRNIRRPAAGTADTAVDIDIFSGFGVWNVKPDKVSIFARVDHSTANPDADGIDYLPIDRGSPFTMGLAGIEYFLLPSVRVSPNVEFVRYGPPKAGGSVTPKHDLVMRLSFYWSW